MTDAFYCSRCNAEFAYKKNCLRHIATRIRCSRAKVIAKSRAAAQSPSSNADDHNSFDFDSGYDSFNVDVSSSTSSSSTNSSVAGVDAVVDSFENMCAHQPASNGLVDEVDGLDDEENGIVDNDFLSSLHALAIMNGEIEDDNDNDYFEDSDEDADDATDNGQFADVNVPVATALVQLAFEKPVRRQALSFCVCFRDRFSL
jgi:hypothetical protein